MSKRPARAECIDGSRVLLVASNLAVGGGVQVAASIVDELTKLVRQPEIRAAFPWLSGLTVELSPQVSANLADAPEGLSVTVTRSSWRDPSAWNPFAPRPFDLETVVFGPRYGARRAPVSMVGLADGVSVFQWPAGLPRGTYLERARTALRSRVSRWIFARETYLVSESPSILAQFCRATGFDRARTAVIPNAVNRAVIDRSLQEPLTADLRAGVEPGTRLFAYVARGYRHKNHEFLGHVHSELARLGVPAKFVVTLTDEEWAAASPALKEACRNVGPVSVAQVADLNNQCDAVIFPSLLETFSATPIEGLATNGVLFASDRDFVRDFCGEAAVYFDPLDPAQCAATIATTMRDEAQLRQLRARSAELSTSLPSARDRAVRYLCAMDAALRGTGDLPEQIEKRASAWL